MGNKEVRTCYCGKPGLDEYGVNEVGHKDTVQALFCSQEHMDYFFDGFYTAPHGSTRRFVPNGDISALFQGKIRLRTGFSSDGEDTSRLTPLSSNVSKPSTKKRINCPALDDAVKEYKAKMLGIPVKDLSRELAELATSICGGSMSSFSFSPRAYRGDNW